MRARRRWAVAVTLVRSVPRGSGAKRLECVEGNGGPPSRASLEALGRDRAHAEEKPRDTESAGVKPEIFAAHPSGNLDDVLLPEEPAEKPGSSLRQVGVVVGGRSVFVLHGNLGRTGTEKGAAHVAGKLLDPVEEKLPNLVLVGANGELEPHLVGDHVVLGAAVDGAHGHDRRVDRVDTPAHERLERHDEMRGGHDRVDRLIGTCSVTTATVERDIDGVHVRGEPARRVPDRSRGKVGGYVDGEHHVGLREPFEKAVRDHSAGPLADLFGRLGHDDERAPPAISHPGEKVGDGEQVRHVYVVTAGVHHGHFLPRRIDALRTAGIRQARFFLDGQGIHVAAEKDGRPAPVPKDADDAGLPHALGHLEAELSEMLGHAARGPPFLEGKLGVGVEVLVDTEVGVEVLLDPAFHVVREHRGVTQREGSPLTRRTSVVPGNDSGTADGEEGYPQNHPRRTAERSFHGRNQSRARAFSSRMYPTPRTRRSASLRRVRPVPRTPHVLANASDTFMPTPDATERHALSWPCSSIPRTSLAWATVRPARPRPGRDGGPRSVVAVFIHPTNVPCRATVRARSPIAPDATERGGCENIPPAPSGSWNFMEFSRAKFG
ncbi:MAG: hypothetical protein KatS3mg076_2516 [Candidatus Binatia bacterium]|nr:MAG: hypothetical protein KatS3mg076_2516 [Candidatus Binatia bacterium]